MLRVKRDEQYLDMSGRVTQFLHCTRKLSHRCRTHVGAICVAEKHYDSLTLEVSEAPDRTRMISERKSFAKVNTRNIGRGKWGSLGPGGRNSISTGGELNDRCRRGERCGNLTHLPAHLKPDVLI